jgi:Secretion system C-terminal sorting domain
MKRIVTIIAGFLMILFTSAQIKINNIESISGKMEVVTASLTGNINVKTLLQGPVSEGFEGAVFPPGGWNVVNPNAASITWQRTTLAAKTGTASARMFFFNYTGVGHLDFLQSPIIDAAGFDTAIIIFNRAYRKFDASTAFGNDTLLIQLSTDLGVTFPVTLWKKGGADLATNPITTTANYAPVPSDWLPDTIKYVLPVNTDNFSISFVGKNGFGQNLYIDDITIQAKKPVAALPVSFISFTAKRINNKVQLDWITAQEQNNRGFEIQRCADADFVNTAVIGFVKGRGTTSSESRYQFTDITPQSGKNYYRIKQIDFDNRSVYSEIRSVDFENKTEPVIYPNSFSDILLVTNVPGKTEYKIINAGGQIMIEGKLINNSINTTRLAKGTYLLQLNTGANKKVIKLVKE